MRRLGVLGTLLVVAACGSNKATEPALVLTISGASTYQGDTETINGELRYVCHYTMVATASGGSPGEVATWGGGHYTLRLASDGAQTSNVITAADSYFLNVPDVPAGASQSGDGYSYWSGPFSSSHTFYYSTSTASNDSVTYQYTCQ